MIGVQAATLHALYTSQQMMSPSYRIMCLACYETCCAFLPLLIHSTQKNSLLPLAIFLPLKLKAKKFLLLDTDSPQFKNEGERKDGGNMGEME